MKPRQTADINQQKELSELEKKLPRDTQKYVLSFFNQKELQNVALVNKNFKQLSQEVIDRLKVKYKDNIFYTVGIPLLISDLRRSTGIMCVNRKEIPVCEIYASFSPTVIQTVRLCKSESQALEYARSLRTSSIDHSNNCAYEMHQSAIFKVIYPKPLDSIVFEVTDISINTEIVSNNPQSDLYPRTIRIDYFDTDRGNIIPLEGIVKIQGSKVGSISNTYGPIFYGSHELQQVAEPEKCRIS